MDKLHMFYKLANAQGIKTCLIGQVVAPPLKTTTPALTISLLSTTKTATIAPGVDQLVIGTTILTLEETPPSFIPTKRGLR